MADIKEMMQKRHFEMETDGFYGAYWKCKTDSDCAMIAMIGDDSEAVHPITEEEMIKIEKIHGTLLLIGAEDDVLWDRNAVMQTYIYGNFPVFEGFNHMQYQIQNPEGFARMLKKIIETDRLPELVF